MENAKAGPGNANTPQDPVCGMKVERATARFKTSYAGQEYFFCCAGCMTKFQANPAGVLAAPPKPMGSGLVSIGIGAAPKPASEATVSDTRERRAPATVPSGDVAAKRDTRAYVCPMCAEVRQIGPGPCPKCGMALEPESPALAPTKTEYTCPMHPEIVRAEPGSCPICGMALEPRTVTAEEENPELRDMTRRFWISVALTAPLLAIAMGSMIWPHAFMDVDIGIHSGDGLSERRGDQSCHGSNFFLRLPLFSGAAGHSFSADGHRSSIAARTCLR